MNAESAAVQRAGLPVRWSRSPTSSPDRPADGKLRPGRRISAVDGTAVADAGGGQQRPAATKPGDRRDRGVHPRRRRPERHAHPGVGRGLAARGARRAAGPAAQGRPVTVDIGGVGGPSAGLMLSLGIVDVGDPRRPHRRRASSRAPGRSRPTAWCGPSAASSSRWSRRGRRGPPLPAARGRSAPTALPAVPPGLPLAKVATLRRRRRRADDLRAGRTPPGCTA